MAGENSGTGMICFWRPWEENGYLGQWHESPFEVDGVVYQTAEMWMMVSKARLFGDEDSAQLMLKTTDPQTHKALGRMVKNFNEEVWNAERYNIVVQGNKFKFTQSKHAKELREKLLATGDEELVEASPRDRVWGIGYAERNAKSNRKKWGMNLLGKALMEVRAWLREQDVKKE